MDAMGGTEIDLYFPSIQEREVQYNARASVADFDACMREYETLSRQARADCVGLFDLRYGPAGAERLDLFLAAGRSRPAPLFIFIHGGYWRSQTKENSALMAGLFTSQGIAVATLEYTLLPRASLWEVVREIRSAVAWLHGNAAGFGIDPDRIFVGGSSAGGHLVGMLLAPGWHEEFAVPHDLVKGAVALSGLYDIQPLCEIAPGEWLRLVPWQARDLSPLFMIPDLAPPLILSVGGLETDGFKNQTRAYEAAWKRRGHQVTFVPAEDRNHFDLLVDLSRPDRPLARAVLQMIRGGDHASAEFQDGRRASWTE